MIEQHEPPLQLPAAVAPPPPAEKKPPSHKGWIWVAVLIVVAAAAYFLWPKLTSTPAAVPAKGSGKGGGGGGAPVIAVRSRKGDMGVYFTGLGTVTPLNTVTVKSRVDGQLLKVQYKEGELVHQDDVLVEIDPRPYEAALMQAEGTLAKDSATLANARIDFARYQTLLSQQAIPEQTFATQKAVVAQEEGVVKTDDGLVENAKLNLTYAHITAPITGVIGLRLVDPGNIVHASDANGLLVITQIQPISAIFTIAEDQLQVVLQKKRAGQKLQVDAYDREMKTRLAQGWLTTLDNQIDQTTGTLKLRATFDNHDNALFPNQFVNIRLLVEEKRGVILVSTATIQRNSQSTYVYVVNPNSTVTVRKVTIGTTEGDDSEITSGLTVGEVVVMTGVDKLQEGSKVTAQIPGETASPGASQKSSASTATKSGKTRKGK
jgi:multidrug efflux system membrane fusion protein